MTGENIPDDVFDPTSSASLTAFGLVLCAACVLAMAGYVISSNEKRRESYLYQGGLFAASSGVACFGVGLFIAFMYD